MVASIWDGFANFAAGALLDRFGDRVRYGSLAGRRCGAARAYLHARLHAAADRSAAGRSPASSSPICCSGRPMPGVNVPYLAMTARISADGGDRSFVAGMRMLFGTARRGRRRTDHGPARKLARRGRVADAYFAAAAVFACVGALILLLVGATYREAATPNRPPPGSLSAALAQPGAQPRLRRAQRRDDGDDRRHHGAQQIHALLLQICAERPRRRAACARRDGAGQRHLHSAVDAARPVRRACARCG